jgi:hypothetical protein
MEKKKSREKKDDRVWIDSVPRKPSAFDVSPHYASTALSRSYGSVMTTTLCALRNKSRAARVTGFQRASSAKMAIVSRLPCRKQMVRTKPRASPRLVNRTFYGATLTSRIKRSRSAGLRSRERDKPLWGELSKLRTNSLHHIPITWKTDHRVRELG